MENNILNIIKYKINNINFINNKILINFIFKIKMHIHMNINIKINILIIKIKLIMINNIIKLNKINTLIYLIIIYKNIQMNI